MEKKQKKDLIKLLKKHRDDVDKMVDACRKFKIPYLTPAYENVKAVLEQMLKDIEKT